MTKIIDRYVTRQVLISASLAVVVLSFVLILGKIFKELLTQLMKHDLPLGFILDVIGSFLPFSLTFTIPWGFLTALLLVFGKMSAENELIALKSNGVSIPRICLPVLLISLVFVGICLWINLSVAPKAEKRMKQALYEMVTSNPLSLFGSDRIIDEFPGRRIYIERSQGRDLFNLTVYELDEELKPVQVVHARRGSIEVDLASKEVLMHLYKARMELRDENNPDDLLRIHKGITIDDTVYPISLQELYDRSKKKESLSGMTLAQLHAGLDRNATSARFVGDYIDDALAGERNPQTSALKTEVSKRFSFSLASLAFALLAVPLAITAHRKETSIGFALSLAIAFSYFFMIIMVDTVRDDPKWHPEWLIWAPNVLFFTLGIIMFSRLSRQ